MNTDDNVEVWDILVRIFHWSLLATFIIAYVTSEDENIVHIYSGYAVLGLISFRVVWGFVGTKYARFSDFVYSSKVVKQYMAGMIDEHPKRYLGHNPAGGWMIVALMLSLFVVTISGLKLYAVEEGLGPLAGNANGISIISSAYADSDDDHERDHDEHENEDEEEDFWEEIHEVSTNFTLLLIALHIAGVLVSSKLHDENLVRAMITGRKKR